MAFVQRAKSFIMNIKDVFSLATSVVPSERQLRWFDTEFYAFMHFGVNQFTDRE